MGPIEWLIDFILHIDTSLLTLINTFGNFVYPMIFLVVFCETGLIVTPFLPGDSLIFIAGAFAAQDILSLPLLFLVFVLAAFLGDAANYALGSLIGPRVFHSEDSRIFKREYLEMAQQFYAKHGGAAIFLARFVPIVRTFAPFVAGVGKMPYRYFAVYNLLGGIAWVTLFILGGFFFGGIQIVKSNLSLVILGIVAVSLLPTLIKVLQIRSKG